MFELSLMMNCYDDLGFVVNSVYVMFDLKSICFGNLVFWMLSLS